MFKLYWALFLLLSQIVFAGSGTTFFVVGDYGMVTALDTPNMVFDAINDVVGAGTVDSIDKPEFFVSCGDNIYPAVPNAPTFHEFNLMAGLFNRKNIANLPVYAIRGNHDSYFDWTTELKFTM